MNDPVKVFLLPVEPGGRHLFYSETPGEEDPSQRPRHEGLRGWAESKFRSLQSAIHHSESRAARFSRSLWERLQRSTHPDEALLSRLRGAKSIAIHHPPTLTHDQATVAWSAFLGRSRRRHWPWFLINLILSPGTLLLAPIPGPNLIGYWIAYRAIHHGLILLGLGHATSGRIETRFKPDESLNRAITTAEEDAPSGYDPAALDEFLRRHGAAGR